MNVIQNRIIQMNIILLIVGYLLYNKYNQIVLLFLVFIVFICNEIIYFFTGLDIYSGASRTELCYSSDSFDSIMTNEYNSINTNFTEGHFKSDQCIPWKESEKNRFDHFIEILDIKEGDYVLDAGCGYGGLVKYFREKGINSYGITISKTQHVSNLVNKENISDYIYYGDYTIFNPELVNKFDFIIIPGSLEHPFSGNPRLLSSYKNKYEKMTEMFTMMKLYFKDNAVKRILTTTLHGNIKFKDTYQSFFTERMFGGLYPLIDEYSVADSFKNADYKILSNEDYTWHYYYVSYCNLSHFGNPSNIGLPITLIGLLLYPHILYAYIYWNYGFWMWQFDGKMHKRRTTEICDPSQDCDLTFEPDINKRPVTLFYTIAQL